MDIQAFYSMYKEQLSVCTDTRKIKKGDIFIALKGENFNGNKFAQTAIEQGAAVAVIDEPEFHTESKNTVLVKDGLAFLQELAHYHRKQLSIPFIGLTGSNGKTTTKELIAECLKQKYKVSYTQGNLNNHIGVPLTLLSISPKTEIAVIEMGASHAGEIAELCQIAAPDYAYITNFGRAHLEGFGSEEGVVKAKSEMYDFLQKNQGMAFVNADEPRQMDKTTNIKRKTFGFDTRANNNFQRILKDGNAGVKIEGIVINSHLLGNYNQTNIAAAVSIALYFDVDITQIKKAIEDYIPSINRSQIVKKNGRTIVLDAYNANPSSMEAALTHFAKYKEHKAVILGDMFELGDFAEQEHKRIAKLAVELGFEEIYLLGDNFFKYAQGIDKVQLFNNRDDFQKQIENTPIKARKILLKGSRGMQLEKLEI